MKRIEEKVVPENADIVKVMLDLVKEHEPWWIYISCIWYERLKKLYKNHPYLNGTSGTVFVIEESNFADKTLLIDDPASIWKQVRSLPIASSSIDPEVIYFLS